MTKNDMKDKIIQAISELDVLAPLGIVAVENAKKLLNEAIARDPRSTRPKKEEPKKV